MTNHAETGAQFRPDWERARTEVAAVEVTHSQRRADAVNALCLIARLHHLAAEPAHLAHQLGWTPSHLHATDDLLLAAKHIGLKARLCRSKHGRLNLAPLSALALMIDGR